jgi:hypothetical protein
LRQGLTAAGRYARVWTDGTRVCLGAPCRVRRYDLELALRALRAVEDELRRLIAIVADVVGLPAVVVVRLPLPMADLAGRIESDLGHCAEATTSTRQCLVVQREGPVGGDTP